MSAGEGRPLPQPAGFDLRAPRSGAGVLDPRTSLLFWGAGSVILGLSVTYLMIRGEFRLLVLLLLAFLGVACLAPRRGIFILTAFLPFMYAVRRSVLTVQEFSPRDPILVFPVITTLAMAIGVLIFYSPRVFHYLRHSGVLKCAVLLMAWLAAEIINPLQGGLIVGVAGAMFFIYPMLWMLFGLIMDSRLLNKLFKLVLVIGCLTSAYGLYQHYFGLNSVEVYELKSKGFYKSFHGSSGVRVISTFAGLGDFARYLTISTFLVFAYFWKSKRAAGLLLLAGFQFWAMLYTAVRTSFLVTFFSCVMLMILAGSDLRRILKRGTLATLIVIVLYSYLYQHDARVVYNQQFSSNPFVVHTLSGITHPTQESTFEIRLRNWAGIVASTFVQFPIGHGLGSTTTAAKRFAEETYFDTDSYFFELFYGSGLPAPFLSLALWFLLIAALLRLCVRYPAEYSYKICFGIICGVLLGSVFGLTLRDNIVGPLAWLLIGWVVREDVESRFPSGMANGAGVA